MTADLSLELDPDSRRYVQRVQRSAKSEVFRGRVLVLFERRATVIAGRISRDFLSGQRLRRRTGSLARSVVGRGGIFRGFPGLQVGVLRGPALSYAPAQELGTQGKDPSSPIPTIRPRGGRKALAIPVGKALTPAGVTRAQYADGPRPLGEKLAFIPIFRGKLVGLLVTRTSLVRAQRAAAKQPGVGRRIDMNLVDVVFRLVRSVEITPKHYLRDGLKRELPAVAGEVVDLARELLEGTA